MVKDKQKGKVVIAASAGGHLSQLLMLEPVWAGRPVVCVSTGPMVREKLETLGTTYIVGECNRQHGFKTVAVMMRCLRVVVRERPDVIISTGAAVGFLTCFWGKLFGAKVIWIDSIANTNRLSMSGRMVRRFADLIVSQWPEVAARYDRVEYAGEVL